MQSKPSSLLLLLALVGLAGAGSPMGIVVPKRSALILGLNQQFRPRAANQTAAGWLAAIKAAKPAPAASQQQPTSSVLYLDRHQQEILAANPNLLNPALGGGGLQTRSDAQPGELAQLSLNGSAAANSKPAEQQSSYRGFSLIELEVRSEQDRRFVQELYGNLSAALNEQASQAHSAQVSPYVELDFWSLKLVAPDDQVDLMVSPKSRPFILSQLARAKIKHRVKIDDVQARLDAQAPAVAAAAASTPPADALKGRQAPLAADQTPGPRAALNESQFFDNYQRLADISQFLETLAERSPEVARVQVIGRSSQGRYLRVLRLGYAGAADSEPLGARRTPGRALAEPPTGHLQPENATHLLEAFMRRQAAAPWLGAVWLDGGTHAREWISPATVLYLAHRLADNQRHCSAFFELLRQQVAAHELQLGEQLGRQARQRPLAGSLLDEDLVQGINDINSSLLGRPATPPRARTAAELTLERLGREPQTLAAEWGCSLELDQLLRRYTFLLMPVLNPDGYEYSHTHNRLWRKTRSASSHPIYRHFCLGADPNRNYDARHGQSGASTHPCSQTYAGATPFTEPETKHQSNFVLANRRHLRMYISFHSYSQMILLPFSHSRLPAPDHKHLEAVGQAGARAIEQTHGTVYRVGPSASILYTASGTASDWAYEKAGVKYSYTIELRDTGAHGFLLPRQQIVPTGEETFNGLLAMIGQMEKNEQLLITSKSSLGEPTSNQSAAAADQERLHVPDSDKLRPLNWPRPRPPLENALEGGPAWGEGPPEGVRDRRPPADSADALLRATAQLADQEAEPAAELDPDDAGFAFEGEGALMEPTREQLQAAAKLGRAHQLQPTTGGRQEHSRRIAQAATPSSPGRNLINSPLLTARTGPLQPSRRESSEDACELPVQH